MSSVYVIGADRGVKIGRSQSPHERLKALQTASPLPLVLHHVSVDTPLAAAIENLAHQYLAERRLEGEWFDVTATEAVGAIEWAISELDRRARSGDAGKQLNLRVYQEDLDAIERIRRAMSPIPAASEVVRQAIHELDKRLSKKVSK